jgi:hypothetical protein
MIDSQSDESHVDANVIDELLEHVAGPTTLDAANNAGEPVPRPPNLEAIAKELGIEVRRGSVEPGFPGIAIPEFYSEREARLAIARGVARAAVARVGSQCKVEEGTHLCPSPEMCDFAETAKTNLKIIDTIAAAVMMPTRDFVKWRNILGPQEVALSDSYGVPREFARIRLRTVESSENLIEP